MATKSKKIPGKPNLKKNPFLTSQPKTLGVEPLNLQPPVFLFQPLINWKKVFGRSLMTLGAFVIVGTIFLTQMAYITPEKQIIVLSKEISDNSYPTTLQFNQTTFQLKKDKLKYGLWPLSDSNPVYLESSGTPGKPGNIVIYGHNIKNIFGNLSVLKEGSEVTITTNQNQTLIYKIDSIKKVFPQSVEILRQGSEERITLFTCTGLFDSMRLVVSGKRI